MTLLFAAGGMLLPDSHRAGYYWMTMAMAAVAFLFYFMVTAAHQKDNAGKVGGNLAAIMLKFILSVLVVILYVLLFDRKEKLDFLFFFTAYILYSVISYAGAYKMK
jgi:hypothetical protein